MLPDDGHLPSELPVLPKRRRTEAQLERKRARDREAQRVNREKNKGRISCMESDLALLQSRLTEMSERMSELTNTLETLQQDPAQSYSTSLFHNQLNQPLEFSKSLELPTARTSHSGSSPASHTLGATPVDTITPCSSNDVELNLKHGFLPNGSYQLNGVIGLYQKWQDVPGARNPTSSPPSSVPDLCDSAGEGYNHSLGGSVKSLAINNTCTIEHIIDYFEQYAFKLLFDAHLAISLDQGNVQHYPRTPSVANLLLIDTDSNPIVAVIGTIMRQASLPRLADSVATYYLIYRLLRWRVYPVRESYEDVPLWYRPSNLQRTQPHPIFVDLIAWPQLRDHLVTHSHEIDRASLSEDIRQNLSVSWPETWTFLSKNPQDCSIELSPRFEDHIWNLSNWTLSRSWARKYPELSGFVNIACDE